MSRDRIDRQPRADARSVDSLTDAPHGTGLRDGLSLSERAYLAIRDQVITLVIPPGSPVNEDGLSRTLGLGRTPIREAIKRLESESLVVVYPRRGTFAAELNLTDHTLLADVRRQLEGHGARRAADRADDADRAELAALLRRVDSPGDDRKELMRLDTQVHRALYRATHNRYLENTLTQYYNLVLRIWYLFIDRLPDATTHVSQHHALLQAVIDGDGDRAHQLAVAHVESFERSVRELL